MAYSQTAMTQKCLGLRQIAAGNTAQHQGKTCLKQEMTYSSVAMIALTRRKQTVVLLKKVTNTFRQKQDLDLQV